MLKRIITNTLGAIAAAAMLAGLTVVLTSVAPEASAEPQQITRDQPVTKGNRLPARITGSACSSAAWPNYDSSCQFDSRRDAGDLRIVRIIALR
jgi:hypothetical protein